MPRISPPKNEGALGIGLFSLSTAVLNYETPVQKIFSGITHPVNLMAYNLDVMARLVKVSIDAKTTEPLTQGVAGPVGIASLTNQAVSLGPIAVLQLAGLLSLNLAFMNVLPIPALDGGRFFFLLIEAVTRKKVRPSVEKWTHTIGFALLIGLIVLITYNDILKIFH